MSDNARFEALEKELAKVKAQLPTRTKGKAPEIASLVECNAAAERYNREIAEEKADAANLAKRAIDDAFSNRPKTAKRLQKNLSPVASELTAKSAKK